MTTKHSSASATNFYRNGRDRDDQSSSPRFPSASGEAKGDQDSDQQEGCDTGDQAAEVVAGGSSDGENQ
jgi:hypothetical protein